MIVAFLVGQIIFGKFTYKQVVTSRPDLQNQLEDYLKFKGYVIDKEV